MRTDEMVKVAKELLAFKPKSLSIKKNEIYVAVSDEKTLFEIVDRMKNLGFGLEEISYRNRKYNAVFKKVVVIEKKLLKEVAEGEEIGEAVAQD